MQIISVGISRTVPYRALCLPLTCEGPPLCLEAEPRVCARQTTVSDSRIALTTSRPCATVRVTTHSQSHTEEPHIDILASHAIRLPCKRRRTLKLLFHPLFLVGRRAQSMVLTPKTGTHSSIPSCLPCCAVQRALVVRFSPVLAPPPLPAPLRFAHICVCTCLSVRACPGY